MTLFDLRQTGAFAITHHDERVPARTIVLNAYRPEGATRDDPAVIVQHGVLRNGTDYRDFWIEAANRYRLCIVAPTFSEADWPGTQCYNNGDVRCEDHPGGTGDVSTTSYACLQRIIRNVAASGAVDAERIHLFGHSAGSQFVHRMLGLLGGEGLKGMIAANAGWYTLPSLELPFPEGLGGFPHNADMLQRLFAYPLQIFAGCADNDPNAPHLPNEPAARRQGESRFARAQHYFSFARNQAERLNLAFNWTLHEIPHIAHDGKLMSQVAAEYWFGSGIPDESTLARLTRVSSLVA